MSDAATPRPPLSPNRPLVAAALTAGAMGSLGNALEACASHEFYAVDLDTRQAIKPPSDFGRHPAVVSGPVRVRSTWIPGSITGPLASQRTERLWGFLDHAVAHLGLRTIVLPRRSEVVRGDYLGPELQNRLRAVAGRDVRVTIGIRAADGRHGHDQLVEMLNLRHAAEEWELDLALDLTGPVPHGFEAEAAVMRLLPRLTLVRMESWVMANGDLASTQAITRRATATLAEHGYRGMISVVPSSPPVRWPWSTPSPSTAEEWTRKLIMEQYDRRLGDSSTPSNPHSELFREQL